MLIPLGPSSAIGVASSPNTQLVKMRLALQLVAYAVSSASIGAYFMSSQPPGPGNSPIALFNGPPGATGPPGSALVSRLLITAPGVDQAVPGMVTPVDARGGSGAAKIKTPLSPVIDQVFGVRDPYG